MNSNFSFQNFVYLDTNAFNLLAQHSELIPKLSSHLIENDECLAVSPQTVSELSDWECNHDILSQILLFLPSVVLKPFDEILTQQLEKGSVLSAHDCILFLPNQLLVEKEGQSKILEFFKSPAMKKTRETQKKLAREVPNRVRELKSNFSPASSGKYIESQREHFVQLMTVQWIVQYGHAHNEHSIESDYVTPFRLYANIVFQKFYRDGHPPKASDLGDLFHAFYYPFVKHLYIEKSMLDTLSKISKNEKWIDDIKLEPINKLKSIS